MELYGKPLKNKSSDQMKKAFTEIFESSRLSPSTISTDRVSNRSMLAKNKRLCLPKNVLG